MSDTYRDDLVIEEEVDHSLDIAIIGMAGRFPGAANIAEFWENLKNGVEAVTVFSRDELLASGFDSALIDHPNYVPNRAIIADEDKFDARLFDLSPREAEMMDPQQRLFLETAWTALEDAGYHSGAPNGLTGVFGGVSLNTYLYSFLMKKNSALSMAEGYQLSIGNDKDFLATRVAYKLNLTGPAVTVQTACSTSLVAIHLACQNLLNYSCDMALAGGVSITTPQKQGYFYQEGMILSKDGHCRAFDAKASGTISGNGLGMVVLKRLAEAQADGDHIYAVIRGSAVNNDGALRVGYTAPSVDGQADAIRTAQTMANVHAETISYLEAHGTGTDLGDPIEISALTQVFQEQTEKKKYCAIGSVKTNIGHLDAAAGVAGFIKTALALKNKQIPASLHFEQPNPKIDFASSPFYVSTALQEWPATAQPRRAGVSSFGIGGTNAHAILEEAPAPEPGDPGKKHQLYLFSARSEDSLNRLQENLQTFFNSAKDMADDIAYTLQSGRKALPLRRFCVAAGLSEAAAILAGQQPKALLSKKHGKDPHNPPLFFMFSGQGSQYAGMAAQLYREEPAFQIVLDDCCRLFEIQAGANIKPWILAAGDEQAAARLSETRYTQPALFAVEYALAKMYESWGIRPQAMVGHSIGEYVAAVLAGVFSLEDAVKVVAARGRLMQQMPAGAMLSVPLSETELQPLLNENLSVAAINAPAVLAVSGTFEAMARLEEQLTTRNIEFRRLVTSHAFHSSMMDAMLDDFRRVIDEVSLNAPTLAYVSNVSGTWISIEEATDPGYYVRHLRQPVRFADNIATLLSTEQAVLLEVGPGKALASLCRRHPAMNLNQTVLTSLPHPTDAVDDHRHLLETLGKLWLEGVQIDWAGYHKGRRRLKIALPTYPFERVRHWLGGKSMVGSGRTEIAADAKNPDISQWFYQPVWQQAVFPAPAGEQEPFVLLGQPAFLNQIGLPAGRIAARIEYTSAGTSAAHINPDDLSELEKVLSEAPTGSKWVIQVPEAAADNRYQAFKLVLQIARFWISSGQKPADCNFIITNPAGTITADPFSAMSSGVIKVLAQEIPGLAARIVEMEISTQPLGGQILTRLLTGNNRGGHFAIRSGSLLELKYQPLPFPEQETKNGYLKKDGVYLLTGGAGRIGRVLTRLLAEETGGTIYLLEKKVFDPQLAADKAVLTELDQIKSQCRDLQLISCDFSDNRSVQETMDRITEHHQTIDGVIHAAGSVGANAFRSLAELNETDWSTQFAAKIEGTLNLAAALPANTGFVLFQSSVSTLLGGYGFAAYAAANTFLDAFARQASSHTSTRWISVNWDAWHFGDENISAELGNLAIRPEEGREVFRRIFANPGPTAIVISTADLNHRLSRWMEAAAAAQNEAAAGSHTRPDLAVAFVAPRSETEQKIATIWEKLLGLSPVGIHDNFFDLGGNSLMGTQLISQTREVFKVELPLRALFEDPTIAAIAGLIEAGQQTEAAPELDKMAELLKQMQSMSDEDVRRRLDEMK